MSSRSETSFFRVTALVMALCVFALTWLAASPELHASLHKATNTEQSAPVGDADHVCAVTLFASGLLPLLVFFLLLLGRLAVRGIVVRAVDAVPVAHPRYRLVPAHAPPAA